ncbi:MAG: SpoIIE family protein phosphatase [bacterium]|nr:SpoIIE family protein phosphatase [bacterium]
MISEKTTLNNRFQVQAYLSEGLLTSVYRARDIKDNSEVILKIIKPENTSSRPEDLFRFKRELTHLQSLTHPRLGKILATGEYQDSTYFAMEYVEGHSLSTLLNLNRKFSIKESVNIIYQLIQGLEYCHSQNMLHLDIRPSNIILEEKNPDIKITDFGLSHLIEYTRIKKPEDIRSIFSYISPEQSGIMKRNSDERSDLYSAGIIFYELLTKEPPFQGTDLGSILHQHIARIPVPPRKIDPQIPEVIEEIVMKLLSKEPESRYQTAHGLLADLERFKKGETSFIIGKQDKLKKLLFHTRLIGREEEIGVLRSGFDRARTGNGQVILVKGEPGMGKSRLVDEMRSYVFKEKGIFLSGRCFSQENKIPYLPYRDILNEYTDRIRKKEKEEKEKEISRLQIVLGDLGEIIVSINPGMEELLGKQPELIPLDPEREHRRFLMIASKFFLNLGTLQEPFVFYLDDLQWSDEASLTLFQDIISRIKDHPVLILATYRDNEVNEQHSLYKLLKEAAVQQYPVREISLGFFDEKKLRHFLSELLLEEEESLSELSRYILNKSKGNPFFSLEITRQLVEEKALQYDEDKRHWGIDWDRLNKLAISNNIVEVVLRRIVVLNEEKTYLLSHASVIGREFPLSLLKVLTEYPDEKLINLIDECISLQLIEKSMEKGKVLFVHDRIRDAFYYKVPKAELKEIHEKIAESIEEVYGKETEPVLFDLAHHYAEAGNKEKALQYCIPAADKAKANYANEEAIRYYKMEIELLEEKGDRTKSGWIRANEGLIDVYLTIGKNEDAINISAQILPLKHGILDKARIYRKIGTAYYKMGEWQKCEDTLSLGLSLLGIKLPLKAFDVILSIIKELSLHFFHGLLPFLFKKKGRAVREEDREIITFYHPLIWMYGLSDTNKAISSVLRALNYAELKIGPSSELAFVQIFYAAALTLRVAYFTRAFLYYNKAYAIALNIKDERTLAMNLQYFGVHYYITSQFKKALEILEQAREKHSKIGDLWEWGMDLNLLGHTQRYSADYSGTLNSFKEYLAISQTIKDNYGTSSAMSYMALAYIEKGEFESAAEWNTKSLALSEENNILYNLCFGNIHMGYLYFELGQYEKAIPYLLKAKTLFEANTFLLDWTVIVYYHLTSVYIAQYEKGKSENTAYTDKKLLKKIKGLCRETMKKTRLWPNHYAAALRVTAQYYVLVNMKKKAERYFIRSIHQSKAVSRHYETGRSLYEYGNFLYHTGRTESAGKIILEAFDLFKKTGSRHYTERCARLLGISSRTENRDLTAQERLAVERRLNTLVTVSHHLSSILDLEQLLGKIVDSAMEVSGAERGFLFLYDTDKKDLQVKIAHGLEQGLEMIPHLKSRHYKLCRFIIDEVQNKATSLLFNPQVNPDLVQDEDIKTYRIKSVICTPLKVRGEVLGLLYLDNRLVEEAFDEQDLDLINSLAIQSGISLQNAFFLKEMVEKERLSEELRLGQQIQTALLPRQIPEVKGLSLGGIMQPAREIGGDYYDFIPLPGKEELGIVIGDVSGKGVAAGLLMAMVKTAIHIFAATESSPKKILMQINQVLNKHIGGEKFMTMLYLVWQAGRSAMVYSSAGHEHILVYRKKKSDVEIIQSGGIILGVMEDIETSLEEHGIEMDAGDKILLYTDGITEAHNSEKNRYGLERLRDVFLNNSSKPVQDLLQAIKEDAFHFIGNCPQYDDMTLVVMETK